MRKITSLLMITVLFGTILLSNKVQAQMPGSLAPIVLLKLATGYWDDDSPDNTVQPVTAVKTDVIADSDGDGIADKDDTCPNIKGLKELNGCPDGDGDGVADSEDECPDVKGTKENKGCLLSKKEKEVIKEASSHIHFQTGSANIKKGSYPDLDKLAEILKKHPEVKARVEGHTDSSGNSDSNLKLSKSRAAAVKKYLIEHGEKEDHITSEGYGSSKPIAPNDTKEGKAENRRVQIIISAFQE